MKITNDYLFEIMFKICALIGLVCMLMIVVHIASAYPITLNVQVMNDSINITTNNKTITINNQIGNYTTQTEVNINQTINCTNITIINETLINETIINGTCNIENLKDYIKDKTDDIKDEIENQSCNEGEEIYEKLDGHSQDIIESIAEEIERSMGKIEDMKTSCEQNVKDKQEALTTCEVNQKTAENNLINEKALNKIDKDKVITLEKENDLLTGIGIGALVLLGGFSLILIIDPQLFKDRLNNLKWR